MLLGVVGNPVLHSLSPNIHREAFKFHGIVGSYLRILPENFSLALKFADEVGVRGVNITSPFKMEAAESLKEKGEYVLESNACNTILFESGSSLGENTDGFGVVRALEAEGVSLEGKKALVLGFGGAGRAGAFGLFKKGAKTSVLNRSPVNGTFPFSISELSLEKLKLELKDAEIVVNTLPTSYEVPREFLRGGAHTIIDANYLKESSLVISAKQVGAKIVSGKSWLLYQAMASSEIFLGKSTPIETLKEGLRIHSEAKQKRIAFVGMMGSGKSSVAKALAAILGAKYFDSDNYIEKDQSVLTGDIIRKEGEDKFRKIEKKAVLAGINSDYEILSLGGGGVLDGEVRDLLRNNFLTIWLWSPEHTSLKRIGKERPFKDKFSALLKERAALYGEASNLVVASKDLDPKEIAERIASELKLVNREKP